MMFADLSNNFLKHLRKIGKQLFLTGNTVRYPVEMPVVRAGLSKIPEIKTLLDAGAGGGHYSLNIYSKICQKIVAVEYDEINYLILQQTLRGLGEKCILYKASITDIPLGSNSVDCIACTQVLEHIKDDKKVIKEFRRVLKSQGYVLITVPQPPAPWNEPGHVREGYTMEELKGLFKDEGFEPLYEDYFFTESTQAITKWIRRIKYVPNIFPLAEKSYSREERMNNNPYLILCLFRKA